MKVTDETDPDVVLVMIPDVHDASFYHRYVVHLSEGCPVVQDIIARLERLENRK